MKKIFLIFIAVEICFSGELDKFKIRDELTEGGKSPLVASAISLVVPGLGEAYVKRFDVGKYFLASEIVLWLAYFGMDYYGRSLNKDAMNYAVVHAGINKEGKPDDFFANIENYMNVYEYNTRKLRDRRYELVYDAEKFYWWWDSDESRRMYKNIRTRSRAFRYYAKFSLVFIIVNHIASAIDAGILAKKFNQGLKANIELLPSSRGLVLNLKCNF